MIRATTLTWRIAPHPDALVPLRQELRELVQLLVLAAVDVDVEQRQTPLPAHPVERVVERQRHAPDLAEARRVEARAVPEHAAHLLVLPRRHQLEMLEEAVDVAQARVRAAQQPVRSGELARVDQPRRLLCLDPRVLQPELRRLVHGLEEELVPVRPLRRALLQREQLIRAQIALVVAAAGAGEDRRELVWVRRGHRGRLAAVATQSWRV